MPLLVRPGAEGALPLRILEGSLITEGLLVFDIKVVKCSKPGRESTRTPSTHHHRAHIFPARTKHDEAEHRVPE